MMVIFSVILALVLLVGIIYALRLHQERTRQQLVAREQPLPPLKEPEPEPEPEPMPEPAETAATEVSAAGPAPDTADWRQLCQTLRDQGRYQEAMAVCRQAWPQWQSFEHAARVMRAAIRNPETDAAARQLWLLTLFKLAAQASFLHDKVDGLPDPTPRLLVQRFDPPQLDTLDMPWPEIGYRELRLLTKSDRKQLVQLLGEPETHQSARIFHHKQWLTAIS